jgi:hypothetical protein
VYPYRIVSRPHFEILLYKFQDVSWFYNDAYQECVTNTRLLTIHICYCCPIGYSIRLHLNFTHKDSGALQPLARMMSAGPFRFIINSETMNGYFRHLVCFLGWRTGLSQSRLQDRTVQDNTEKRGHVQNEIRTRESDVAIQDHNTRYSARPLWLANITANKNIFIRAIGANEVQHVDEQVFSHLRYVLGILTFFNILRTRVFWFSSTFINANPSFKICLMVVES